MNLIIPGWESVLQMLIPMCTVICIAGAILLLLHAEGSRSKRLLAYVMLAWGIAYVIRVLGILFGFMRTMVIVALYFVVMYLLGETPVRLAHWDTLLINMGQFNVWYRLVIAFSVFAYIAYLILIVYRYEVSYRQWCDANYASTEDMEISWLHLRKDFKLMYVAGVLTKQYREKENSG